MRFIQIFLILFTVHLIKSDELQCDNERELNVDSIDASGNENDVLSIVNQHPTISDTDFVVFYKIQSEKKDSDQKLQDYINNNLDALNFELSYSENNKKIGFICTLDSKLVKNVTIIKFPIDRFKFFTEYTIKTGYKLKTNEIFNNKDIFSREICFGKPTKPYDITYTTKNSAKNTCDIEINWKAPEILNAPSVCYYELQILYTKGSKRVNVSTSKYTLNNAEKDQSYKISIDAINENSCYENQYPNFRDTCEDFITASGSTTAVTVSCKSNEITIETTTKGFGIIVKPSISTTFIGSFLVFSNFYLFFI